MKRIIHFPRTQQGAALLVSLIILVMVSLMGISALRSSIFSGKVATSVQADAMTFEAAETALGVTFRSLSALTGEQLFTGLDAGVMQRCIQHSNPDATGACTGNTFMDERGLLKAQSSSFLTGYSPVEGFSFDYANYRISILAESEMPTLNLENFHLQEMEKFGMVPASEIRQE